jgi:predicted alpha/beta-fold hydrolase
MFESTHISTPKSFKFAKPLYLLLSIAGSIAPWFWLLQDPVVLMSPTLFLQLSFANQIATAWASDLLISASVFFVALYGFQGGETSRIVSRGITGVIACMVVSSTFLVLVSP